MINKILSRLTMIAFVPFLTMPSALVSGPISLLSPLPLNPVMELESPVVPVVDMAAIGRKSKADAIDSYYRDRNMPLAGYGMKMVLASEKYNIDWTLLPAISVRESSGGRAKCGYNPFGWGSCKLSNFASYDAAIETVGRNLGGENKNTARYYKGNSSAEKLYYFNGTVEPAYPSEVLAIMRKIESYNTK